MPHGFATQNSHPMTLWSPIALGLWWCSKLMEKLGGLVVGTGQKDCGFGCFARALMVALGRSWLGFFSSVVVEFGGGVKQR